MTNTEKQSDEILVLQSIFEKKFHLLDDNQYEILIEFDLITRFTIRFNNQTSLIQHLPPFTLIIHYHDEYPSDYPPSFILSCFYFSKFHLQKLCQKLDHYPFVKGDVCVYDWIELIKHEINTELNFNIKFEEEEENDPRALNGYLDENVEKIFQYLINYNHEREEEQFRNQLQTCLICANILPGSECIYLHRCGHFYCRSCLNNYVQITLDNGKFGEKIHCPENECKQVLLPTEIKEILQNDQLYERYERITLQHSLDLMNDILWCPRCQCAVLINNGDDNLAMCDQCRYTFCKKCKEIFHSQTLCRKEYLIQQLKLQQEKERQRIERQREEEEEALAQMTKTKEMKKSSVIDKVPKQKYRQIVIKLSEENALLEEILNAERIESLNTQHCPKCNVRIEKNGGCSHMHCSRCNHDFTWQTIDTSQIANTISLMDNPNLVHVESIKEELNKEINIDEDQNEEDLEISINNRSTIGSAIVNRVKQCPAKSCRKLNVKMDKDNWMVCNECMKQFCFQCGRLIHGTRHFEKKCQRYTTI
ncbi:unnamed protein product [Rotaria sordida]|uniref:RBR-type E3 ubiquitin transferase n=1 Tax=Rotaria sordida TaxID=392033 RepID=A0A815FYW5_9BILA|nr:unnamed protein product [Rotaria sordida]CAF3925686.1 unnamed protein product [Rotaria sordida]